jgi:hypothetical protein
MEFFENSRVSRKGGVYPCRHRQLDIRAELHQTRPGVTDAQLIETDAHLGIVEANSGAGNAYLGVKEAHPVSANAHSVLDPQWLILDP